MAGKSKSNNKKRAVKGSMRMKRRGSKVMRGGETTGEWGSAVYGGSNAQHAVPGSNVIQMNNPYAVVGQAGGDKCNMRGGDDEEAEEAPDVVKGYLTSAMDQVSESASNMFGQQPSIKEPVLQEEVKVPVLQEEVKVPAPAPVVVGGSRKRRSAKGGKSPKKGKSAKKMRNKRR